MKKSSRGVATALLAFDQRNIRIHHQPDEFFEADARFPSKTFFCF
jgi:hypothetical protein